MIAETLGHTPPMIFTSAKFQCCLQEDDLNAFDYDCHYLDGEQWEPLIQTVLKCEHDSLYRSLMCSTSGMHDICSEESTSLQTAMEGVAPETQDDNDGDTLRYDAFV